MKRSSSHGLLVLLFVAILGCLPTLGVSADCVESPDYICGKECGTGANRYRCYDDAEMTTACSHEWPAFQSCITSYEDSVCDCESGF